MVLRRLPFFFFTFAVLAAASAALADDRPRLPARMKSIEPVNVMIENVVVEGTVTVRVRGAVVNPADVTFRFEPDFPHGGGTLTGLGDGRYVLWIDNVPANRPHVLTVRSAFNDTVMKNGLVERLGRTYTGSIRIDIPAGRHFSFGERLLDLN